MLEAMARLVSSASFAFLAIMLSCGFADAAPSTTPTPSRRAVELFEQSAEAYREGRFQMAVDKLLEARALKSEPVLLYNLARAYEALGRWEEAANAYEGYVAEEPAAGDRRAIEGRVRALREQVSALDEARKADAKPATTPDPRPSSRAATASIAPWLVAGSGVLVAGAGLALGLVANGQHEDAVAEPVQRRAADIQASAESLADVATVVTISGAAIVLVGVAWGLLQRRPNALQASGGIGLRTASIGWTFR